jgi:hypothetical protein
LDDELGQVAKETLRPHITRFGQLLTEDFILDLDDLSEHAESFTKEYFLHHNFPVGIASRFAKIILNHKPILGSHVTFFEPQLPSDHFPEQPRENESADNVRKDVHPVGIEDEIASKNLLVRVSTQSDDGKLRMNSSPSHFSKGKFLTFMQKGIKMIKLSTNPLQSQTPRIFFIDQSALKLCWLPPQRFNSIQFSPSSCRLFPFS